MSKRRQLASWLRAAGGGPLVLLLAVGASPTGAFAQPVSTPTQDPAAEARRAPSPSTDGVTEKPSTVAAPKALSALDVSYPDGATGEAEVVLTLVIDEVGRVVDAQAQGPATRFSVAASEAARSWVFTPAVRGGVALKSRIQVAVSFSPPVVVPAEAEPAKPPTGSVAPPGSIDSSPPPASPEAPAMEVIVEDERAIGTTRMSRAEVRQLPGAFNDPYRAIDLMPGVTPIASGLPYFFIRGAPPGDVGYFFDQVSVPLLFHAAAGPGVIHPAFIETVDLHAGGYPARYGRFAGGIVEGTLAKPQYKRRAEANIRLLDAGGFVEAPLGDGPVNVMLGGRYSYTGGVISLIADDVSVGYWDYQSLVTYDASPKDSLSLFAFGSHDYLSAKTPESTEEQELLDLTFHRVRARYERALSVTSRLQINGLFGHERTGAGNSNDAEQGGADLTTRTWGVRAQYDAAPLRWLSVGAGFDLSLSRSAIDFTIGTGDDGDGERPEPNFANEILPVPGLGNGLELFPGSFDDGDVPASFASHEDVVNGYWLTAGLQLGRLRLTPGLRMDLYRIAQLKTFVFEPRVAAAFQVTKSVKLIHSLGIAHQPQSFAIPLPGFTLAADNKLQQAFQTSAGVEVGLPWQVSGAATVFQNAIVNTSDIFGSARLRTDSDEDAAFDDRPLSHSYGFELFLRRSLTARLGGALSYTLSRATRSLPVVRGPSSFDRRHVLNLVLAYDITPAWRLGARLAAYSGVPAEVAYAAAVLDPPRGPWFYRIDWRLERRWRLGTDGSYLSFVAEVLNTTLNRESLNTSCYAYGCTVQKFGPVTLPSLGLELSL